MTTTDANGIIRYEDTDPITPIQTVLNTGLQSVSDAITGLKTGLIYYVPNIAARDALVASFNPTASKPLYVHRANGGPNGGFERTIDGTNWTSFERRLRIYSNDGSQMPMSGVIPTTQSFVNQATTNGAGVMTVTFPEVFATPPIVTAMTAQGSGINPVIDSNGVTTDNVRLIWPGNPTTSIRVHIHAIGWVAA